jgi:hypothetical protein
MSPGVVGDAQVLEVDSAERGLDSWEEISNNPRSATVRCPSGDCWECRWKGCDRCRRGRCGCGQGKYGKDLWTVLAVNLPDSPVLTVATAPGAEKLPWDKAWCGHSDNEQCGGKRGCRVVPELADAWQHSFPRRWRLMRETMRLRLKRAGHSWPVVEVVQEMQKRGVVHLNFVMDVSDLAACLAFVREWRNLADKFDFGFIDERPLIEVHNRERGQAGQERRRVAGYLAGYLTAEKKGEASVFAAMRNRCTSRVWSVAPSRCKDTRVTMSALRLGRQVWGAEHGFCTRPSQGYAVLDWRVLDCATGELSDVVWREGP